MTRPGCITRVVACVFALMIAPHSTEACSCSYRPPAQKFCTEQFTILVKVLAESAPLIAPSERTRPISYTQYYQYAVDVQKVFRSDDGYYAASKVIQTLASSGMCGKRLNPGHTYLIASSVEPDFGNKSSSSVLFVHSCSLVIDLAYVPTPDLIENPPDCSQSAFLSPYELYLLSIMHKTETITLPPLPPIDFD